MYIHKHTNKCKYAYLDKLRRAHCDIIGKMVIQGNHAAKWPYFSLNGAECKRRDLDETS